MKESKWTKDNLQPSMQKIVFALDQNLQVLCGKKLPYSNCITKYDAASQPFEMEVQSYETDLLITENFPDSSWTPRVLIETKLEKITTHDAITFSQKAFTHKSVHPYLRYGILLGAFDDPLPGPLVVHGGIFDFIMLWRRASPDKKELEQIIHVIHQEIEASRRLEELIKAKRVKGKKAVYSLHRKLEA